MSYLLFLGSPISASATYVGRSRNAG